jgi:hypothetical protein
LAIDGLLIDGLEILESAIINPSIDYPPIANCRSAACNRPSAITLFGW